MPPATASSRTGWPGGRPEWRTSCPPPTSASARRCCAGCGADAELVALAKACLAPAKTDRPTGGGEVARRVADYLAGVQERLRQAELQRERAQVRAAEERKRRRLTLALAAAVLFLVAGA